MQAPGDGEPRAALERTLDALSRLQRGLVAYRANGPGVDDQPRSGSGPAEKVAGAAPRRAAPGPEEGHANAALPLAVPAAHADGQDAELPFSSSTLAELYMRQGFPERALDVYRQVVSERPSDEKARTRLAEITVQVNGTGNDEELEGRRLRLKRAISGLELLLQAVQRG